jgi:hypothetical protein
MTGKEFAKADLEELFVSFEKRQEGRQDEKLKHLEERIVNQFHIISEGVIDQTKLLAEGHSGILARFDRMEKENERQHLETRSLLKLSFSELDRRLSDLESQMTEMQEWKRKIAGRFPV